MDEPIITTLVVPHKFTPDQSLMSPWINKTHRLKWSANIHLADVYRMFDIGRVSAFHLNATMETFNHHLLSYTAAYTSPQSLDVSYPNLGGTDGSINCTPANSKMWNNKLLINKLKINLVTSQGMNIVGPILWAINNLKAGGCALIELDDVQNNLQPIYLFAQYFAEVTVYRYGGESYLIGKGFLNTGKLPQEVSDRLAELSTHDGHVHIFATLFTQLGIYRDVIGQL